MELRLCRVTEGSSTWRWPISLSGLLPTSWHRSNSARRLGSGHILIVPFIASALCQAFLLALWVAVSQATTWMRLTGLVAGAVYLEALVPSDLRREFLGTSTITIAVTTSTLLVMRGWESD